MSESWEPEKDTLSLPELEHAIEVADSSLGLEAFADVRGMLLADIPVHSDREVLWGNHAGLCASCVLSIGHAQVVFGERGSRPRWLRCPTPRERWGGGLGDGDKLLVPLPAGASADTVLAPAHWRSLVVRNGVAVRFDCPVDSLLTEFERHGAAFRLRPANH